MGDILNPPATMAQVTADLTNPATALGGSLSTTYMAARNVNAMPGSAISNPQSTNLLPKLVKHAGNPIFTKAATAAPSITWAIPVDVTGSIAAPLARYYLYFSTDHDDDAGGIYLATADEMTGPWTQRGLVYTHGTGSQTEQPSPIPLPNNGGIGMTFQTGTPPAGSNGPQAVMHTWSADGRTGWKTATQAIRKPSSVRGPGNGSTGYLRHFSHGNILKGYANYGSGESPHFALVYSRDNGVTWDVDPRLLGYGAIWTGDPDQRIDWIQATVVQFRGRDWLIAGMRPPTFGGVTVATRWIAAPLSQDWRRLAAPAVDITPPAQAWENGFLGSPLGSITDHRGVLWVLYRGADKQGGFGLARLDLDGTAPIQAGASTARAGLLVDGEGRIVPPGACIRAASWDGLSSTALPGWLTTTGTAAVAPPATSSFGAVTVSTAATVGAKASIQGGFDVDLGLVQSLKVTLDGMSISGANAETQTALEIGFRNTAGTLGATLWDAGGAAQIALRTYGTSVQDSSVWYRTTGGNEFNRRRNLSLLILPRKGEVWLLEDDQDFGRIVRTDFPQTGLVRLWAEVTALTARTVGLTVQQISYEITT